MSGSIENARKAAELQRLKNNGEDVSNHRYTRDLQDTAGKGVKEAQGHLDRLFG
jgi:hypothetical protein